MLLSLQTQEGNWHSIRYNYCTSKKVWHTMDRGANQITANTVCGGVVNYVYKPAVTSKLQSIMCTSIFTQFNYYYRLAVASLYVRDGPKNKIVAPINVLAFTYVISSLGNKIIFTFKSTSSSLMPAPVCSNCSNYFKVANQKWLKLRLFIFFFLFWPA